MVIFVLWKEKKNKTEFSCPPTQMKMSVCYTYVYMYVCRASKYKLHVIM